MKKLSTLAIFIAPLLATQVLAGTLMVNGDLVVTTNLTAGSITLGSVIQTNWNFLPQQGYKYVIVPAGTNDLQRGSSLKAAYTTATTLSPTSSNRVVVLVPPGSYNLGSTGLTMNTSYVDLIGLVPAQMTSKQAFTNGMGGLSAKTVANVQCPVLIYASASGGTLVQNVDYVRVESVIITNTNTGFAYYPSVNGSNTVLRHVSVSSMQTGEYAGFYLDCANGDGDFATIASGTFIDCIAGDESFGAGGIASGTFIWCTAGTNGFGGAGGIASGMFLHCVGLYSAFAGGDSGTPIGTFIDCIGTDNAFGGFVGGGDILAGTYIGCVGGAYSFGGGSSFDNGVKLQHCKAGANSFGNFNIASDDFNYNDGGANTFVMMPNLPTSVSGLPSGSIWSSNGVLRVSP